ncbi:hypothetical protein [Kitasatospora sp. NPDC059571]|uniref:hypothetical protein n=1 Tax=Kitasatospora sp. NPDC059571 TaxID=3346871 RepID=UPI00367B19F8
MTDRPAGTERQTLDPRSAAALRAFADEQRARTDRLTAALEDIARHGLPRAEDCVPWEVVRDRRLAELAAAPADRPRDTAA